MSSNLIVNNIEVGAGATVYTAASNALTFGTNGSERVRIDANGDLNLGNNPTNQYGYRLNIEDSSQILYAQTASSGGTELKLFLDHGNTVANFGTVSTSHLAFVTANTEKLRITSTGKVGINSTSPTATLESFHNGTSGYIFRAMADLGSNVRSYDLKPPSSDSTTEPFSWNTGNAHAFQVDGNEKLRIADNGKIGIGTDVPDYGLHVYGAGDILIEDSGNGSAHLRLRSANGGSDVSNWKLKTSSNNYFYIENDTVGGASQFTIDSSGDVDVRGNIKSNNLPGRNIIINGAMQVAQRKPSGEYTGQAAYATVDRMYGNYSVPNTDPITECHVLTSGDTGPWEKGFRKSYRMKIGYQSGTAASYFYQFQYRIEAQDIANSGWDYTSSSSYITLSFWVKSSVAYNPSWFLRAKDGTEKIYRFQPGTLTANTWTKVTKTIPGNSGLTFNDDNGEGLQINLSPYWGTNYSTASPNMDTWENWDSASRAKDTVATWFTTNGSTMEITGLQLEVGSIATEFEHLPYAEHLRRCQRYYQQVVGHSDMVCVGPGRSNGTTNAPFSVPLSVPLAKSPTINSCNWSVFTPHVQANINNHTPAVTKWDANNNVLVLQISGLSGMTNGRSLNVFLASGHTLQMDSEL